MAIRVLNEILEKARKQGLIEKNPCELLEIRPHRKKRRKGLTDDEIKITTEIVENMALKPVFMVLLATGLRIGELLALTDKDVDFEKKTLNINKNVVFIGSKKIIQTTKTDAGNRIVPFPTSIQQYLQGKGVLFDITYNAVHCGFRRLTAKSGINVSAHILRHTYANKLEEAGIPPKVKQYLLGHSDLNVTQNIYTDIKEDFVLSFVRKIEDIFKS